VSSPASLSELTAGARRLALVGLAKNTGKTETLAALLRELRAAGRTIGVTSVGRDGEEHDVIDHRIEKPRVLLSGGSLVASTDALLRSSGVPYDLLEETDVRTPLGRVLITRLRGPGAIEVAGPSAAVQVRDVADAMLAHGAEQVLIDGAIDRRAASSPDVADGLVMSTGAVLADDIDEVVRQTREAVELVRLPTLQTEGEHAGRLSELALLAGRSSLLAGENGEPAVLAPRLALTAGAQELGELLDGNPAARWLLLAGALPERFLGELLAALRRRERELTLVVADATRVFLAGRGLDWYRRQGLHVRVLRPIELLALTVNPLAPQSHSLDSAELRALLTQELGELPVFDVLHPDYRGARESVAGA
jgi:hypothetical protein